MMVNLDMKYLKDFISDSEIEIFSRKLEIAHEKLHDENDLSNGKGWLNLPSEIKESEIAEILSTAEKIRNKCDTFIVIGIGGSYLGAKAGIEFLKSKYYGKGCGPEMIFAGKDISSYSMQKAIDAVKKSENICINVISKSGSTLECAVCFRILKKMMEEKYGKDEAKKRIFCTTDSKSGILRKIAEESGYKTFDIPTSVGGRYSVLTAVGLLPLAVMGADIREILKGAKDAQEKFSEPSPENDCYKYALLRNILYSKGKTTELIAGYEPNFRYFFEWWKQLFAESEGKCGKGIFPASVLFSSDLHSMGQFIQQGNNILFETVVTVKDNFQSVIIPSDEEDADRLNYLAGKDMNFINSKAFEGTVLAHTEGGVPNIHIEVDRMDEYNLGYLIYFFEKACGISAYILGVNPFNQPGVEAYKNKMFSLLNRPHC